MPSKLPTMCKQALAAPDASQGPLTLSLPSLTPSAGGSCSSSADIDKNTVPAVKTPIPTVKTSGAMHIATPSTADSDSDDSSFSYDDSAHIATSKMSLMGAAECLHAEPKCILLLTPGIVSPMVMCQWEMVCSDFFRANKKIMENEQVSAVLPGLKDMHAHNWVATHGDHLAGLKFPDFVKELQVEFLPEGWDDELHAKIRNARLKSADSFPTWMNDIHHLNIILQNTEYFFSDVALCLQLESLLDSDL